MGALHIHKGSLLRHLAFWRVLCVKLHQHEPHITYMYMKQWSCSMHRQVRSKWDPKIHNTDITTTHRLQGQQERNCAVHWRRPGPLCCVTSPR